MNTTQTGCLLLPENRLRVFQNISLSPENFAPLPYDEFTKSTLSAVLWIIMILGLILNAAIIIWIVRGNKRKSSVNIQIVSLSTADLLTLLTRIPIHADLLARDYDYRTYGKPLDDILCRTSSYLQTAMLCVSLFTLVYIAVERYIAICHPITHHKQFYRRHVVSAAATASVWAAGLLVGVVDLVYMRVSLDLFDESFDDPDIHLTYGYSSYEELLAEEIIFKLDVDYYNTHKVLIPAAVPGDCADVGIHGRCMLHVPYDHFSVVLFVLIYVLPLFIMTFCYANIIHRLWIRKPVADMTLTSNAKTRALTRQMTVLLVTLISVFGLLWLPYWCSQLLAYNTSLQRDVHQTQVLRMDESEFWLTILSYLPLLSTPVIYMIMTGDFRKQFKQKVKSARLYFSRKQDNPSE